MKHDLKIKTSKKFTSMSGFFLAHKYRVINDTLSAINSSPKQNAAPKKLTNPNRMNTIKSAGLPLKAPVSKLYE
jgi:hypothetical protein